MRDPHPALIHDVLTLESRSAPETEDLAERLGRRAGPGDVLLLAGDLGAGKTTFVRGFARGLGIESGVKSPSFAIHVSHPGRLVLHHLDLYRLSREDDVAELGLDDLFGQDGIVLVEWGDRLGSLAPVWCTRVRFEETGPTSRRLVVEGPRDAVMRWREAVRSASSP